LRNRVVGAAVWYFALPRCVHSGMELAAIYLCGKNRNPACRSTKNKTRHWRVTKQTQYVSLYALENDLATAVF
jgi:hypothetical protein